VVEPLPYTSGALCDPIERVPTFFAATTNVPVRVAVPDWLQFPWLAVISNGYEPTVVVLDVARDKLPVPSWVVEPDIDVGANVVVVRFGVLAV